MYYSFTFMLLNFMACSITFLSLYTYYTSNTTFCQILFHKKFIIIHFLTISYPPNHLQAIYCIRKSTKAIISNFSASSKSITYYHSGKGFFLGFLSLGSLVSFSLSDELPPDLAELTGMISSVTPINLKHPQLLSSLL